MNTHIERKSIRVLCVGGKMKDGEHAISPQGSNLDFSFVLPQKPDPDSKGVSNSDVEQSDALLLFMAGSGWDWLERLRLPDGVSRQRPLIAVLDRYNENFALALLRWGVEEVIASKDCDPKMLQHSILAAITRFQRNHQLASNRAQDSKEVYEHTALKTLDTLPFGIMFTDKESRVLFMNAAAKRTCTNGSGIYISKDQRCCASSQDENSSLHRLIRKVSLESEQESEDSHTIRITGEDGESLTMLVVSVGSHTDDHGVAIFVDNGGGFFNISEETLKSVYQLTQSEAGLLLRMVQGETLAEISEARNVTMHTVRAQLKSVFSKTGTNRQASLIKKVLTGPAVLMQK